jgi:hypothetical protein
VKKVTSKKVNGFGKMNARELAEATAPYAQEMVIDQFESPSPAARRRWERARRKPGRPRRGKGARVISVSVERGLLSESDNLAKSLGLSRASLIERGLKAVLAEEGKRS